MNHQLNRLTGGTDITQLNQSLVINPMPSKRYKYNHQITGKTDSRSIPSKRAFDKYPMPSKRYNLINLSITARRNKDILSAITARRAFRGMAGLAVLYPSVVDYIDWSLKTLSASCVAI